MQRKLTEQSAMKRALTKQALRSLLCVVLIPVIVVMAVIGYVLLRTERTKLPSKGIYYCEELGVTLSFDSGNTIALTLPNGAEFQLDAITSSGELVDTQSGSSSVRGWYDCYPIHGYIDVEFSMLPIGYEENTQYRFSRID
ncbi:MAG: hypothetical protein E7459_07025 [Ruminococcaceae bacterium]|nr:hypothetical protein [Oscillospiraceae bacterium]